jgi:hypothetical protein
MIQGGYVTHLATNGAGVIHDWELAYHGATSEDVRANLADGTFGLWEETGRLLNTALAVGAYHGLGYGSAVGAFIQEGVLLFPQLEELSSSVTAALGGENVDRGVAALALLGLLQEMDGTPGRSICEHPWREISVQAEAYRAGVPFTGHPMFGHDIIYAHPLCSGTLLGLCAERDFLTFARSVQDLSDGVYLSVGSAVMSPMVFEKSLSMARNIALQTGDSVDGFLVEVVDLASSSWDWTGGREPPEDHPDYYLRYMKTFSRAGAAELRYLTMDNRDYLTGLLYFLDQLETGNQT